MRIALLVVFLAACNQLYGLTDTEVVRVDAMVEPDDDGDGLPNVADNCPTIANDGHDVDDDGVGDACDNCPLVPNGAQGTRGDGDAIGDFCDPSPTLDGDCLVLLDTFANAGDPRATWDIDGERFEPIGHALRVQPEAGPITFLARGLTGRYDVQILADIAITSGGVIALSNVASPTDNTYCGVRYDGINLGAIGADSGSRVGTAVVQVIGDIRPKPAGTLTTVRLTQPRALPGVMQCRGDYGYSLGLSGATITTINVPAGGAPGFRVEIDTAMIRGVALYQARTGACPPPIVR
jgi:hypothetical protein